MLSYNISSTIHNKRMELGITQEQLAKSVGASERTVSRWEKGKSLPDMYYLLPLSNALNISVQELIRSSKEENTNSTPEKAVIEYAIEIRGENMKLMMLGIMLMLCALIVILYPMYTFICGLAFYWEAQALVFVLAVVVAFSVFISGYVEKPKQ